MEGYFRAYAFLLEEGNGATTYDTFFMYLLRGAMEQEKMTLLEAKHRGEIYDLDSLAAYISTRKVLWHSLKNGRMQTVQHRVTGLTAVQSTASTTALPDAGTGPSTVEFLSAVKEEISTGLGHEFRSIKEELSAHTSRLNRLESELQTVRNDKPFLFDLHRQHLNTVGQLAGEVRDLRSQLADKKTDPSYGANDPAMGARS